MGEAERLSERADSTPQLLRDAEEGGALPQTEAERMAVRQELERILAGRSFRNSKRYSAFLRYIVEETLEGRADHLKERVIGTDVFAREPNYDTSLDHVVRSAAGEVRRRLAQYFLGEGAGSQIRIDIRPGSYIPHFRISRNERTDLATAGNPGLPASPGTDPARSPRHLKPLFVAALCSLTAILVGVGIVRVYSALSRSSFDRFWDSVAAGGASILICVGDDPEIALAPPGVGDLRWMTHQRIFAEDAVALSRIITAMTARNTQVNVRTQRSTTFDDLKQGPAVLIGAFNNEWTQRSLGSLRFRFERREGTIGPGAIVDRQNPEGVWSPEGTATKDFYRRREYGVTRDYALVSKHRDLSTGQTVVVAAGIMGYGTVAASEFLADPTHLKSLTSEAPPGWQHKNLQVLLSIEIFNGNAGPPKIVAVHFWSP